LSDVSQNKRLEQTGTKGVGKVEHSAPAAHAQRYPFGFAEPARLGL